MPRLRPPRTLLLLMALAGLACGRDTGTTPSPPPTTQPPATLGPLPVLTTPAPGTAVTADTPTFTVRNASGFTSAEGATYTFEVFRPTSGAPIAQFAAPAGAATTSGTPASALPRGMNLAVRVTARTATASVEMPAQRFGSAAVACAARGDGYAKAVADSFLPVCRTMPNFYSDPREALGPPNAVALGGKDNYSGIVSLGDRGYVTVDMEACAADAPGADLRVHQAVGSEPVSVYVAGSPAGPFVEVAWRAPCGERLGGSATNRYCDFDLGAADVREARYVKVEDGEHFPCAEAGTNTEGADLDAVQILQFR